MAIVFSINHAILCFSDAHLCKEQTHESDVSHSNSCQALSNVYREVRAILLWFPWQAEVDLRPLTAERRGQLGLTLSNPSGPPGDPHYMAHQDYPSPSHTLSAHIYGPLRSFLSLCVSLCPLLRAFDAYVSRMLILYMWQDERTGLAQAWVTSIAAAMGASCTPSLFGLTLKGSRHPWGQLAGAGWVTRGPPPVTIKWLMGKTHNSSSCKLLRVLKL